MIVRHLKDLETAGRVVSNATWTSRRLLLREDGMGFSLHDTTLFAGTRTPMQYRHHLEAVYCIQGDGWLEDLGSGERHAIAPGMVYALNQHDRHVVHATTDLRLVCVFNPPLKGPENHDADGGYPLLP